jgi:predicted branched-subunit amino acid permease
MAKKPSIWSHSKREKLGIVDGINLFFGALLGANLGTVNALPLPDYIELIALLAALIMAIRLASVSERRVYAYATLASLVAIVVLILLVPFTRPDGLGGADAQRLVATILIWVAATTLVEFYPSYEVEKDEAEEA